MELKMFHIIVLSVLLSRVPNVQGDCVKPWFTGNQILTTEMEEFPEGTKARLQCTFGYIPVIQSSSRYVTCKDSKWTNPELQCKKKSCGNPGEIQHGRYLIPAKDGTLFGAVITAECNEGYILSSRFNTRNCLANGWDGRAPICEAVQCERPDSLPHGTFEPIQDTYQFEEAIKYSCDSGLILTGNKISSCSANGTFQPAPPQCRSLSCQRPSIQHAFKIGGRSTNTYEYKNFVEYQCEEGYKMNGSGYLICEENGWNPQPPKCNIVTCPKLPLIDHGKYEPNKPIYKYNDQITYYCKPCFKLSGPRTKTCSKYETFTPDSATTCKEAICPKPRSLTYGDYQPKKYSYKCGESITYHCNTGYKMNGNAIRYCSETERFTSPTCEIWTCPRPEIKNGNIESMKSQYNYGESLVFSCNHGFKLNGFTSIKCIENERFDHPPPKCDVVTCPRPPPLINGEFWPGKDSYKYGEKIQFSCKPGFGLKGSPESDCSGNETFILPTCKQLSCTRPNIKNAHMEKTNVNTFSGPVLYRCDEGFKRDGPGYLNCTPNGWDPNPDEQCKEITCEAPNIINGKRLGGPIYKYNTSVEYECDEGYIMNGSNIMTCKPQGWKGRLPKCHKQKPNKEPSDNLENPDDPQ